MISKAFRISFNGEVLSCQFFNLKQKNFRQYEDSTLSEFCVDKLIKANEPNLSEITIFSYDRFHEKRLNAKMKKSFDSNSHNNQ